MNALPTEIVEHLTTYLDIFEQVALRCTCRQNYHRLTRSLHESVKRNFGARISDNLYIVENRRHLKTNKTVTLKSPYDAFIHLLKHRKCLNCAERPAMMTFRYTFNINKCATCLRKDTNIIVKSEAIRFLVTERRYKRQQAINLLGKKPHTTAWLRGTAGTYFLAADLN